MFNRAYVRGIVIGRGKGEDSSSRWIHAYLADNRVCMDVALNLVNGRFYGIIECCVVCHSSDTAINEGECVCSEGCP